jgi:hypothetical protein
MNEELSFEYISNVFILYAANLCVQPQFNHETTILMMDSALPHASEGLLRLLGPNKVMSIAHAHEYCPGGKAINKLIFLPSNHRVVWLVLMNVKFQRNVGLANCPKLISSNCSGGTSSTRSANAETLS